MKRLVPWLVAVALGATLAGCRIEIDTIRRDAGEDRDAGGATDAGGGTDAAPGTDAGRPGRDACVPLVTDLSAIGRACLYLPCPAAYTCQPFEGIVHQERCAIRCTGDCDCPATTSCQEVIDKTQMPWTECLP